MQANGDFARSISASSSWTKLAEFGHHFGHTVRNGMACQEYLLRRCIPNNEYLFNAETRQNLNMVSVHKQPTGLLALNPQGLALLYFQTTDRNPVPFVDEKLMAGWYSTVAGGSTCLP